MPRRHIRTLIPARPTPVLVARTATGNPVLHSPSSYIVVAQPPAQIATGAILAIRRVGKGNSAKYAKAHGAVAFSANTATFKCARTDDGETLYLAVPYEFATLDLGETLLRWVTAFLRRQSIELPPTLPVWTKKIETTWEEYGKERVEDEKKPKECEGRRSEATLVGDEDAAVFLGGHME